VRSGLLAAAPAVAPQSGALLVVALVGSPRPGRTACRVLGYGGGETCEEERRKMEEDVFLSMTRGVCV
jgi:hypothetical protein